MPFVPTDDSYTAPATPAAAPPKTPRVRIIVELGILVVLLGVLGVLAYIKFFAP